MHRFRMKGRNLKSSWVTRPILVVPALVLGLGLTACTGKSETPQPTPTLGKVTTCSRTEHVYEPLRQAKNGGSAKDLTTPVRDTANEIRRQCGASRGQYHIQPIGPVAPTTKRPGVTANGCVLSSGQSVRVDALCFPVVPQSEAVGHFDQAVEYSLAMPGNGKGGFVDPNPAVKPDTFMWRVTSAAGVQDVFYTNRVINAKVVQALVVQSYQSGTSKVDKRELWCVDGNKLVYFGDFDSATNRRDATGIVLHALQEPVRNGFDEWAAFRTARGE
jgi:hypothetical protein